ncbi:hypothetical protein BV22DRAFT_1032089 [Leucogyrophana mollusca]|uniref:Uncharacterized protein n=1 Tax=Leucogyrophana mollusca TaxID=85980 RepID=A0ACB8BNX8_9AGAM|nr:hypothetical protein BV22DRAFT_1032089 [Leucogyrophana mollusca]
MATIGLLRTRTVYRKAVAAKNGDASKVVKTEELVKVDVQGDQKDANKAEEAQRDANKAKEAGYLLV